MSNPTAMGRLMDYVSEYESDTFSAKGANLNGRECLMMVDALMEHAVDLMVGKIHGEYIEIDGVALSDLLEGIRGEERQMAISRPDLTKKGYKIIEGRLKSGIMCLDCKMVSYHPENISKRYCGNCRKFHPKKRGIDV